MDLQLLQPRSDRVPSVHPLLSGTPRWEGHQREATLARLAAIFGRFAARIPGRFTGIARDLVAVQKLSSPRTSVAKPSPKGLWAAPIRPETTMASPGLADSLA